MLSRILENWRGLGSSDSRLSHGGLFFSLGLMIVGAGLQTVVVTLAGQHAGFSTQALGFIGSAYFVGYLFGSRLGVHLILGVAHIRAFAGFAGLATAAAISYTLWIDAWFWALLRFLSGFCLAGMYIVVESWVNRVAETGKRGQAIANYRRVDLTASVLAQGVLLAMPFQSHLLFALLCMFLALSIVPISVIKVTQPNLDAADTTVHIRSAFRAVPVPLVGCFVFGMINAMIWSMGPLFVFSVTAGDENFVSLFLIVFLLGGAVAEGPVGRFSDSRDRRTVVFVAAFVAAIVAVGVSVAGAISAPLLLVAGFFFGLTWIPMYSILIALAHDQSDPKLFLSVSSSILLAYAVGASLGPTLGAWSMGVWGPESLFVFISVLLLGMTGFGVYRKKVRRSIPAVQQAPFVAVPSSAAELVFELDPRVEETSEES